MIVFNKKYILLLIGCLVVIACQKEKKNIEEDTQYRLFNIEKAGWKSKSYTQSFSGIQYKATMVPLQYYILKNEGDKGAAHVDSIYQSLKSERIIEVEFKQENEDDLLKATYTKRDYEASVKYMSFAIENDFSVVTQSGDTVSCSGVTFERNFKVAPFKRILLNFGNIPEQQEIKLLYNDKLFGNGFMKFSFKETPIKL